MFTLGISDILLIFKNNKIISKIFFRDNKRVAITFMANYS